MKLGMSSKNLESLGFFEVLASISCRSIHLQKDQFSSMPENNDGAKVCAEEHGNNCNDGSAGCTNNEINNGIHRLSRPAMASTNSSSIISGHLYSTDDKLKRGRPPPLLKNACEDIAVGEEPPPCSWDISVASYSSSRNIQHSCRHCPAPSSSAASYPSSSRNIQHNCRHYPAPSSSTATRSSLPGHIWHGCRHLFTASGSVASCSFLPRHIWHSFRHLFTVSSSAASWRDY
ncbi:unnamed protein product [Prunus brigantina]